MNNNATEFSGFSQKHPSTFKWIKTWIKPILVCLLLSGIFSTQLKADDPGIAKVRLIQQSDTSYIFEVDIPQAFLSSFKAPILPEGFTVSTPEREFQSGWVTLKAKISSNSRAFQPDDIIILPWARNAVDITAQWLDGKTYKGFFNRTMSGIQVPLNQIMSVQLSTKDVIQTYFVSGLIHWGFKLVHLLLILTLVLAVPGRKVFKLLLSFSLGQMTAMVFAQLPLPGFDLLFGDLILLLLVFYISYFLYHGKELKHLSTLVFFTALLHALSFGNELESENLLLVQRIQAVFAFNLAIDMFNYGVCGVFLVMINLIGKIQKRTSLLPIVTGSLAVFSIIFIFDDNILANQKEILDFQQPSQDIMIQSSYNNPVIGSGASTSSKGFMTSPIMVFLSVEPYEARKEILITGSEAVKILGLQENKSQIFPADKQDEIKRELELLISGFDTTYINNKTIEAEKVIANFVTLGKGGVSIKETAVDELINEAIIGISLNYNTQDFPDSIQFNWHLFPEKKDIDLSLVDPHATFSGGLSPTNKTVKWESRIKGFKLPVIEPIEVKNEPIALASYTLWILLVLVLAYQWKFKNLSIQKSSTKNWAVSILILGFVLFPFARPALGISALSHAKPSHEKGKLIVNDLLSNVYRAFDRKQEDVVYDRLAMSVTNEQLTDIYLQNRQSMALENRGGARATIDEVNITQLFEITKAKSGKYIADTEWTVRGSVNHFGHTHYRQNKYRALVTFVVDNEHWKISNIEILDARRLY